MLFLLAGFGCGEEVEGGLDEGGEVVGIVDVGDEVVRFSAVVGGLEFDGLEERAELRERLEVEVVVADEADGLVGAIKAVVSEHQFGGDWASGSALVEDELDEIWVGCHSLEV